MATLVGAVHGVALAEEAQARVQALYPFANTNFKVQRQGVHPISF